MAQAPQAAPVSANLDQSVFQKDKATFDASQTQLLVTTTTQAKECLDQLTQLRTEIKPYYLSGKNLEGSFIKQAIEKGDFIQRFKTLGTKLDEIAKKIGTIFKESISDVEAQKNEAVLLQGFLIAMKRTKTSLETELGYLDNRSNDLWFASFRASSMDAESSK